MTREQDTHWQYGYWKGKNQSTTNECFFSEERRQIGMKNAAEQEEPESLQLGKLLRTSSVALGIGCLASPANPLSEQRVQYIGRANDRSKIVGDPGSELRKGHIDHSYGHVKTCSQWQPEMAARMGANANEKYGCRIPSGFQAMKAELQKSSVPFGIRSKSQPTIPLQGGSEMKKQFVPKSSPTENFNYLGEELRASNIDFAGGQSKSCAGWRPCMTEEMERHAEQKFAARRPEGFEKLAVELRKSNVPLAGAGHDFMMRTATMAAHAGRHQRIAIPGTRIDNDVRVQAQVKRKPAGLPQ